MSQPLLELQSITRRFGSITALDDVSLRIESGEVVCLLGENGAGKTTLMRIAAGVERPDGGTIRSEGITRTEWDSTAANGAGVAMVHQHFLLVGAFSALDNLLFSRRDLPFLLTATRRDSLGKALLASSGVRLDSPQRLVRDLAVGERSALELARALSSRPRLLILDEPTAVLTPPEISILASNVRHLASTGTAVVLVTHKLADVYAMADRVVVMRTGRKIHDVRAAEVSRERLAELMMGEGRPVAARARERDVKGEPALELRGVSTLPTGRGAALQGVSLTVSRGEIAGIIGVSGNGQTALAELLRGVLPPHSGTLLVEGMATSARELLRRRSIGIIPADRTEEGLFHELTVSENLALKRANRSLANEEKRALSAMKEFGIRARSAETPARELSGGNQQKLLLARELAEAPRLLVAAEPTRGLDPESTAVIRSKLLDAAAEGTAVVLMTSDLDEARELSDALYVLYRGTLSERLTVDSSSEILGRRMAGLP